MTENTNADRMKELVEILSHVPGLKTTVETTLHPDTVTRHCNLSDFNVNTMINFFRDKSEVFLFAVIERSCGIYIRMRYN